MFAAAAVASAVTGKARRLLAADRTETSTVHAEPSSRYARKLGSRAVSDCHTGQNTCLALSTVMAGCHDTDGYHERRINV